MGRKGEQDVFPHGLCQVHQFGAGQLDLEGEVRDSQLIAEFLEAAHAFHFEIDAQLAGGEEAAAAQADVQLVAHFADGANLRVVQVEDRARVRTFHVHALVRDLVEMNLHKGWTRRKVRSSKLEDECQKRKTDFPLHAHFRFRSLSHFPRLFRVSNFELRVFQEANRALSAFATDTGTNASTLPPSRAISFTIRELR